MESSFENLRVNPDTLPKVEEESFTPIDIKHKHLLLINQSIEFLILTIFPTLAFIFLIEMEENKTMVMILTGIGILLWNALRFTNIFLAFPVKAYLIRERDISYKKGWYNFKLTTIPFNRIQHVEIKQSFLQKLMKISTIKIFTAGGSTSDLSIPGLKNEKAQEIKEYLSQNISTHE